MYLMFGLFPGGVHFRPVRWGNSNNVPWNTVRWIETTAVRRLGSAAASYQQICELWWLLLLTGTTFYIAQSTSRLWGQIARSLYALGVFPGAFLFPYKMFYLSPCPYQLTLPILRLEGTLQQILPRLAPSLSSTKILCSVNPSRFGLWLRHGGISHACATSRSFPKLRIGKVGEIAGLIPTRATGHKFHNF